MLRPPVATDNFHNRQAHGYGEIINSFLPCVNCQVSGKGGKADLRDNIGEGTIARVKKLGAHLEPLKRMIKLLSVFIQGFSGPISKGRR